MIEFYILHTHSLKIFSYYISITHPLINIVFLKES